MGPFVVLAVFLQNETVHREGCHGVEEGEDGDGDKELSRGGVVADQEEALAVPSFTGGSVKVDLVEPDSKEKNGRRVVGGGLICGGSWRFYRF